MRGGRVADRVARRSYAREVAVEDREAVGAGALDRRQPRAIGADEVDDRVGGQPDVRAVDAGVAAAVRGRLACPRWQPTGGLGIEARDLAGVRARVERG